MKRRLHFILLACMLSLSFLKAAALNNTGALKDQKEQQFSRSALHIQSEAEHVSLYTVHALYHLTAVKKPHLFNLNNAGPIVLADTFINREHLLKGCYSKRYLLHHYPTHNFW